jgi:hypothetical protein
MKQHGTFWHSCFVISDTVNDKGDIETRRQTAACFCAAKPGKDCPAKPRVAKGFKDGDEMNNCINCLKKRKRGSTSTNFFGNQGASGG